MDLIFIDQNTLPDGAGNLDAMARRRISQHVHSKAVIGRNRLPKGKKTVLPIGWQKVPVKRPDGLAESERQHQPPVNSAKKTGIQIVVPGSRSVFPPSQKNSNSRSSCNSAGESSGEWCTSDEDVWPEESPLTLLGPGNTDPFASHVGHDIPLALSEAIEYSWQVTWADIIVPRETKLEVDELRNSWRRLVVQHPIMAHNAVVASSGFAMVLRPEIETSRAVLRSRAEHMQRALQTLSNTVQNFNGVVTDQLLLGLCGLSTSSGDVAAILSQPHPLSPLAAAQSLHLFGGIKLVPAHLQALRTLTKMRGGPQNAKQYAVQDFIEWVDLYAAARLDEAPHFEWARGSSQLHKCVPSSLDPARNEGAGLRVLKTLDEDLHRTFLLAFRATRGLELYHKGTTDARFFRHLVLTRNEVQHRLLSMGRPSSPPNPPTSREALIEICRLSGLIYNDFVLYPLPYSTGVKPTLAKKLFLALRVLQQDLTWWQQSENSDLILWAAFVGEVAARRTMYRVWFEKVVLGRVLTRQLDLDGFLDVLGQFLWWDHVCLPPALILWDSLRIDDRRLL